MRIVCKTCKGRGVIRGKVDLFKAVFTLGISALDDLSYWEYCKVCDGDGYLLSTPSPVGEE